MKQIVIILFLALTLNQQISGGYQLGFDRTSAGYPSLSRESNISAIPTILLEKELLNRGGLNLNRSNRIGYPEGSSRIGLNSQMALEREGSSFIIPNEVGYNLDIDRSQGLSVNGGLNYENRDGRALYDEVRDEVRRNYQSALKTGSSFPAYTKGFLNDKYDLAGKFVDTAKNSFEREMNVIEDSDFVDNNLREALDEKLKRSQYYQNREQNLGNRIYNGDLKKDFDNVLNRNFNQDLGRVDENIPKRLKLLEELRNLESQGYQSQKYENILAKELEIRDLPNLNNIYQRPPSTNGAMNPNVIIPQQTQPIRIFPTQNDINAVSERFQNQIVNPIVNQAENFTRQPFRPLSSLRDRLFSRIQN